METPRRQRAAVSRAFIAAELHATNRPPLRHSTNRMSSTASTDAHVPSFLSVGMVTASSSPASVSDVLVSDASGAIVAPIGGAYVWMGEPLAPVRVDAGTCMMVSTGGLSSSSSSAIGGGASSSSSVAPIQPVQQWHGHDDQWDLQARPTEEQVTGECSTRAHRQTKCDAVSVSRGVLLADLSRVCVSSASAAAQQAAEDEAADDSAWQTAMAPSASAVPYTVPADVLALIMAQAPAPFVAQPPGLDPLSPAQLADTHRQAQRFQQHVRQQAAAQPHQQQQQSSGQQ